MADQLPLLLNEEPSPLRVYALTLWGASRPAPLEVAASLGYCLARRGRAAARGGGLGRMPSTPTKAAA
jgi:hypothetical protein